MIKSSLSSLPLIANDSQRASRLDIVDKEWQHSLIWTLLCFYFWRTTNLNVILCFENIYIVVVIWEPLPGTHYFLFVCFSSLLCLPWRPAVVTSHTKKPTLTQRTDLTLPSIWRLWNHTRFPDILTFITFFPPRKCSFEFHVFRL